MACKVVGLEIGNWLGPFFETRREPENHRDAPISDSLECSLANPTNGGFEC